MLTMFNGVLCYLFGRRSRRHIFIFTDSVFFTRSNKTFEQILISCNNGFSRVGVATIFLAGKKNILAFVVFTLI